MLIKKELETISVQQFPEDIEKGKGYYAAAVLIKNLKRSGKVLVIDIFKTSPQDLCIRFFSDGKTYLICEEWPAKKWVQRHPDNYLDYFKVASTEQDRKKAYSVLKDGLGSWGSYSIKGDMSAFASEINSRKSMRASENKYSLMKDHFAMFPEYPKDLKEYCEQNIFGHTYIFVSKCIKNKRQAVCGHCGHKYEVEKNNKPGKDGSCPSCHMSGIYKGDWTGGSYEEKADLCIAQKVNNQLLVRWAKVTRSFYENKRKYSFEDFYRNLYLKTDKGDAIYSYHYQSLAYYGYDWRRRANGDVYYGKSFVYTNNLREVFGDTYHHVDIQGVMEKAGPISIMKLIDNLKNIPATEYLVKMNLTALAAEIMKCDIEDKQGFTGVLGVSKQYLPLYRKYNVSVNEHNIIKASKTWVNERDFEKLRELEPQHYYLGDISKLLNTMSFERFVNYFSKQKAFLRYELNQLITYYKDYISMSVTLKVDLSRKSIRFPDNIKEAHDIVTKRYNEIKHQIEDERFKQAIEKLYAGMKEYSNKDYCIVYPTLRSELIAEGQSLNHCVGNESYYLNHIAGTSMIFFVRRVTEPEKPYFTMELDMKALYIRQLYGFGDCSAPPEVRKFANNFLKKLRPNYEERIAS